MKKLLLLAAAASLMAACGESPTQPAGGRLAPSDRSSHDFECRSGYVIAYDENGNPYCVPQGDGGFAAPQTTTTTTTTKPKP